MWMVEPLRQGPEIETLVFSSSRGDQGDPSDRRLICRDVRRQDQRSRLVPHYRTGGAVAEEQSIVNPAGLYRRRDVESRPTGVGIAVRSRHRARPGGPDRPGRRVRARPEHLIVDAARGGPSIYPQMPDGIQM